MKVLGEIDLDDLLTQPSSTFYRFLKAIKKTVFEDDQRIILRAHNALPQDLIDHVKWTLNYLDVPEFFLILETNDESNKLALSGIDNKPLVDIKNNKDHGSTPRFDHQRLCAYMHAGLHVWPDGTISPCCDYDGVLDYNGKPFLIHDNHLNDVFNSDAMQGLRQQMVKGQQPKGCSKCFMREGMGLESRRTLGPYRLDNLYGEIDWEAANPIRYIGSHPTNHCNLSCRICSAKFSSIIETENRQQGKTHPKVKRAIDPLYDQLYGLHDLRSFEILGGEPFIMNRHLDFMTHIIANGIAEQSTFQFTTNGTVFPEFFDDRPRFKRLEITFSIDDIRDRFEYQRNRAKWDDVLSNIERFKSLRDDGNDVKLGINITVSIMNVFYLPELLDWLENSGFDHHSYSILSYPSYLSIDNMTHKAKAIVLDKLDTRFDFLKDIIRSSKGSDGREFVNELKTKDAIRKQDFRLHHREIAIAMGFN